MNEKDCITTFVRKPARKGKQHHFEIPSKLINLGIIDSTKFYEVRVYLIDDNKSTESESNPI